MAIKLKTVEGTEFSFDTVEEFMEFKKKLDEEESSKELTSEPIEDTSDDEIEVPETEPKFEVGDKVRVVENKSGGHNVGTHGEIRAVNYVESENRWSYVVSSNSGNLRNTRLHHRESDLELSGIESEVEVGDKVRIVSSEDGSDTPYHYLDVGSVGKVVSKKQFGGIIVEADGRSQCLLPHHYVKLEPLGKDVNGEDLYEGDYVTGSKENEYAHTGDTEVMEVLGYGESPLSEEANIQVKIDGDCTRYNVDSSKFIKLSDKLDEAKTKFEEINGEDVEVVEDEHEFKVGDKVRVVGNDYGHYMELGELREIKEVDPNEPKYNLSGSSCGYWAGTSDIEPVNSSPKFGTGDVVKVTESFSDILGDRAICGAVYNYYDENLGFGEPFVGTVLLGDNIDKIELVCRAQDRLDKY